MLRTLSATLLVTCLSLTSFRSEQEGRDPLQLYPQNYRVLLENQHVRVLDFRLAKGASESFHDHPRHVALVLTGFRIRFTFPDGTTAIRETRDGDVLFSDAVTHASENIGETDAHGILIELRSPAASRTATESSLREAGEMLTAFTFVHGLPGQERELEQHLLSLTAPTRAEAGNAAYDLYRSRSSPHEFLRFEQWRDEAALEAHKGTAHIRSSFQKRQDEGWSTEITLWERVEPASR